jgi:hypothetical protein
VLAWPPLWANTETLNQIVAAIDAHMNRVCLIGSLLGTVVTRG